MPCLKHHSHELCSRNFTTGICRKWYSCEHRPRLAMTLLVISCQQKFSAGRHSIYLSLITRNWCQNKRSNCSLLKHTYLSTLNSSLAQSEALDVLLFTHPVSLEELFVLIQNKCTDLFLCFSKNRVSQHLSNLSVTVSLSEGPWLLPYTTELL